MEVTGCRWLARWQLQGSPLCLHTTIAVLQEPCLPKPKLKIGSNQWGISWLTVGRGFLVFDLDDKLPRHHQHPLCTLFSAEQAVNGTDLTSPFPMGGGDSKAF